MLGVKRPVREEDKTKSYYKYYEKEMYYGDPQLFLKAEKGPLDISQVLKPTELNVLLDEITDQEAETGYYDFKDGTAYVASYKFLPGVTGEMLDWWFAWHGLDPFRYTIWNPEDHCGLEITDEVRELLKNPEISNKEKIYQMTHIVSEDVGSGVAQIPLNFDRPWDIGFDRERFESMKGTIICSADRKEIGLENGMGLIMAHVGLEKPEGLVLRTRFWLGFAIDENMQPLKVVKDGMTACPIDPYKLLCHDIREFSNLGSFLPSLYAEEKDNW